MPAFSIVQEDDRRIADNDRVGDEKRPRLSAG
jgi:hypothetical protein